MGLTRPRFSQFDTTISSISDPITVLNKSSTQANIDIGFIFNRDGGVSSNIALFWQQSANTFVLAFSANTGEITGSISNSNIAIGEYANLRINTLTADKISGTLTTASQTNITSLGTLTGLTVNGGTVLGNTSGIRLRTVESNGVIYIQAGNGVNASANTITFSPWFSVTPTFSIDIANRRVGIKNANPTTELDVTGTGTFSGNVTANYFFGNGSQLSGIITSVVKIISGNSDITTYEGSNIAVSVGGVANTVVFTSSNTFIKGSLLPTANLTYDLGSPTNRFRSAYFSGSTIYVGNSSISESTIAAIVSFPTGDYGDLTTSTVDAFGVQSATSFDLNAPGGVTVIDLEVLS
jgi:hypothetical protein